MRIGIDLGGTKIAAACMRPDGTLGPRHRVPTPSDYGETLDAVHQLVETIEADEGARSRVGIGTPGALSPWSGVMKNANNTALNGMPFRADLEARLDREVRMANDADCFALSEAVDGAAAGASVVFGVIVGTGCGGGIVIDGKVIGGSNAIGGEWGHNPLPWPRGDEVPGPLCDCGRRGCIELYLAGTGLRRDHQAVTGQRMNAEAIEQRGMEGDPACVATLDRYVDRMARSLATVINFLDPEVIVLGGGVSRMQMLYQRVPAIWEQYVFSDHVATRLVENRHGASSGLRGAAWLWPATAV
jgi:fructokinase